MVSPARLTISEQDPKSTHQVTVVNRGQSSLPLVVQKRNFTAASDGSLKFDPNAPYAAADWLSVQPSQFDLAPGATQVVSATIATPDQAEPGDHQVALVFLSPSPGAEGNVRVNRGVATPVYVTVPGQTDDSVQLSGLSGAGWSFRGDVDVTATLVNTGNTHRDFRGPDALAVSSAGRSARFADFTVPRGATRVITASFDPPLVCVCRPTVTFRNADGTVQSATLQVVVFPWWLGAAAGLVLALVVFLIIRARRTRVRPARAAGPATPPPAVGSGDA